MNVTFRHYRQLFKTYLKPHWPRMLLLAALLFSGIGLQLSNPQILRYFIDAVEANSPLATLLGIALFFFVGDVLARVVSILTAYISNDIGWRATNQLRTDLVAHCLDLDMAFHHEHLPGEMIERIDGDVSALAHFFSSFVLSLIAQGLLLLGVLLTTSLMDWRIGLIFTVFTALLLLSLYRIRHFATPRWMAEGQARADHYSFLEERLSGLNDIRANGAIPYTLYRFYHVAREHMRHGLRAMFAGQVVSMLTQVIFTCGYVAALTTGVYLTLNGALTVSTTYLIVFYAALIFNPLSEIVFEIDDLQHATASIARVTELYNTQSVVPDGPGAHFPPGPLAVECTDVTFRYGEGELALEAISFKLEAGKTLGLLGHTGSGKTTLTRLLLRLYDPTQGHIQLGGIPLVQARKDEIQSAIGIVTQDVNLFYATVRDNLTFFDGSIDDQRIIDVLHLVGLDEWYARLPQGLDSEVVSGGGGFSAGEAQLLAFARIFLKNPGIVLLDEASSRLDPHTERRISHAMDLLLQNRTAIIIAHRLETVCRVDDILIMDRGRICEYGPREVLAHDQNSRFSALLCTGMEETLA